ncbi:MAG: hypothetical protein M3Q46_15060 [Verrucomicrobiota bacterium]|nr:hypothetical protein [Verrucomicrobiota bacterium]
MFGKLLLALAIGLALVQAAVNAASLGCCPDPAAHQASLVDSCCAAMSCCVISGDTAQHRSTPTTAVASAPATVPPPSQFVSPIVFPTAPRVALPSRPSLVAHSPPPLSVTGIFLI